MRHLNRFLISIIFAIAAGAAFAQTPEKKIPWYEGFEILQKQVSINSFGADVNYGFRMISYHASGLTFKVDPKVMRREWEPFNKADGSMDWTTRTRLVYQFAARPLYEYMDFLAKALEAYWVNENGVVVLYPNPEPQSPVEVRPPLTALARKKPQAKDFATVALLGAIYSAS